MKRKRVFGKAKLFFLLFFLSVAIQKSNYLIYLLTGIDFQETVGFTLLTFPLLFVFLATYFSKFSIGLISIISNDALLRAILIVIHINLLYGIVSENSMDVITQEYWTGLIVLFGYRLSTDPYLLQSFDKTLIPLFLLFAIITVFGAEYLQQDIEGFDIDTSVTTATLAYEISPILDFWPFLFMVPFFKYKNHYRLWILLPFLTYLAFQFFFLKRAPTLRCIGYLIMAMVIVNRRDKSGSNYLIHVIISLLILLPILFVLLPDKLIERFLTEDNARQVEALVMLEQLSFFEVWFGRGLGGYFHLSSGGGLIEVSNGEMGKHILHIGALYPILKGGILLACLIYAHTISSIMRGWKYLRHLNAYQLSALTFLIVYSLFRLIEGPFSPGAIFDGFLYGLSLGLLNRQSIAGKKL